MLLNTGFSINPMTGALDGGDLLCRYVPYKYFIDLLQNGALWFTRVYKWQIGDPCEGGLLPVFRKEIDRVHAGEKAALYYMRGNFELALKSDFGCCFSLFDNVEYDNMWRIYTPPPEYGVFVVIKAESLMKAISDFSRARGFVKCFLKRVKYVSDSEAESMALSDCDHVKTSVTGSSEYNPAESHFLKRKSYQHENEVRALIGHSSPAEFFWHDFLDSLGVSKIPFINGMVPPYKKGFARIDVVYQGKFSEGSHCVFLSENQAELFERYVTDRANVFFSRPFVSGEVVKDGIYVPFDRDCIEEIVIHPSLSEWSLTYKSIFNELVKYDLQGKARRSSLYTTGW